MGLRNLVVAPAAEEWIFRACIIYHLQPLFNSCNMLCIVSPLFFSIVFQVCYTTAFGAYSAFLMLRTGNVFSAIVTHSLCNLLGLPDPVGAIERGRIRWGTLGQLAIILVHVMGVLAWIHFLYPMSAIDQLRGNVSYQTIEPFVFRCLAEHSAVEPYCLDELARIATYSDAVYFILRHFVNRLKQAMDESKTPVFYENALEVLDTLLRPTHKSKEALGAPIKPKSELSRHTRLSYLRHLLTQAWIQFLDNPLSDELMLKALKLLGDGRLERMTETRLLADYVIPVFDVSATTIADEELQHVPPTWSRAVSRTMLRLVQKGGLNYPRLYPRLYQLLDDSLLLCPEAERFLTDLDLYLSSLHLASHVVAAYTKRLAQLALVSPLRLTTALLLLIRNALQRHPKCGMLINRRAKRAAVTNNAVTIKNIHADATGDPYRWDPDNMDNCGALESSLWEVGSLIHHYSRAVAKLAHQICNPSPSGNNSANATLNASSPSEQLERQRQLTSSAVKRVRQNLRALDQSNARMPVLSMLTGWIDSSTIESATPDVVV